MHKKLAHGSFAVEHFIPYAFVSHDLIWNLIPADPSFNSRKNDKLLRMEDYFEGYYLLHKTAIEVMTKNYPVEPIMEDYLSLFPNADAQQLPDGFTGQLVFLKSSPNELHSNWSL